MCGNVRRAKIEEIEKIIEVYEESRKFMRYNGNYKQWICGYPSRELIYSDINTGNLYVYDFDNKIVGVFTFFIGKDNLYENIKGSWTKNYEYGVVHRMGILKRNSKIGSECLDYCLDVCKYLRIDTHAENIPMRMFLNNNGFKECGIIIIEDGSERIGYDKSL